MKNFMSLCALLALLALIGSAAALAAETENPEARPLSATIYELGHRDKPIYKWKHEVKPGADGTLHVHNATMTLDTNKEIVSEDVDYNKDQSLRLLRLQQSQLGSDGTIEVKDGNVNFSYTIDGKTKTDHEKLKPNFIVGPTLVGYLQKHWDEIKKGDKVETRFGVVDRRETVGFQFFKDGDTEVKGKKAIFVTMKPTSFFIAKIVKPLKFTFTADGQYLLELEGRTNFKSGSPGSWKDVDALTVYQH